MGVKMTPMLNFCVSSILLMLSWWFFLFLMFFGLRNPFQLFKNAWPSRMTLKLEVMWCYTWPLLTLAVLVQEEWIFFVSYVFWVREFIPTSHKCVTFTDDLETQGHVMLYVTFTNFGCACPRTMNFFFVANVFLVREFIPTNHKCVTFTDDLETRGHVMLYVTFTNFGCACPRTIDFFCF